MKKKLLAIIMMANMVLCSSSTFVGGDVRINHLGINQNFDTVSFSNDDYLSLVRNTKKEDDIQIQNTMIGYLSLEKAYVRNPEKYIRANGFVEPESLSNKTIRYRESESEYLKSLFQTNKWFVSKDNIMFHSFTNKLNGKYASASIVEEYTYFVNDDFDGENFRKREYFFELEKNNENVWKIVSVKTNDPWELEGDFDYEEIEVYTTEPILADCKDVSLDEEKK